MTGVDIRIVDRNSVPVLTLAGELDLSGVRKVEQVLSSLEQERPALIVLDLQGLTFMDSSGLKLILEADLRARGEGRRLALIRGPNGVHRVFTVALLDKRLEFLDDPVSLSAEADPRSVEEP